MSGDMKIAVFFVGEVQDDGRLGPKRLIANKDL